MKLVFFYSGRVVLYQTIYYTEIASSPQIVASSLVVRQSASLLFILVIAVVDVRIRYASRYFQYMIADSKLLSPCNTLLPARNRHSSMEWRHLYQPTVYQTFLLAACHINPTMHYASDSFEYLYSAL